MKNGKEIVPSGCRWCGVPKQNHCQRWSPAASHYNSGRPDRPRGGFHGYEVPTDAQIKERMIRRRAARSRRAERTPFTTHPAIPPFRRVPFRVQVGDGALQELGYFNARDLAKDTDAALIGMFRAVADEIERQSR